MKAFDRVQAARSSYRIGELLAALTTPDLLEGVANIKKVALLPFLVLLTIGLSTVTMETYNSPSRAGECQVVGCGLGLR